MMRHLLVVVAALGIVGTLKGDLVVVPKTPTQTTPAVTQPAPTSAAKDITTKNTGATKPQTTGKKTAATAQYKKLEEIPPIQDQIDCRLQVGCDSIATILNIIANFLISIAGTLFFFMFLWGGLKYVSAGGDVGNTKLAWQTISNAVIGLIVVISSYGIIRLIVTVLVK